MISKLYFKYLDEKRDAILICNRKPISSDYITLSFSGKEANSIMNQQYPELFSSPLMNKEIKTSILALAKNIWLTNGFRITENRSNKLFATWLHHEHMDVVYTIVFNNTSALDLLREVRGLSSKYTIDNWRQLKDLDWNYMGDLLSVCAVKVMSCGFYEHKITGRNFYSEQYEFERSPKIVFAVAATVAIAAIFSAITLARSDKALEFVEFASSHVNNAIGKVIG